MKPWKQSIVSPDATLRDSMETMECSPYKVALVAEEDGTIRGVATDGDIRRGLLDGVTLKDPICSVMSAPPKVVKNERGCSHAVRLMKEEAINQVPIVDEQQRIVGLEVRDEVCSADDRPNPVVIMAGGLGTRLRPITRDRPKPLVKVGEKPILETVVELVAEQGFENLFLSVNYKAEMIEAHFGDGTQWGVEIDYIREDQARGTAGPLSIFPDTPNEPVVVINGDLLTSLDVGELVDHHVRSDAAATMCVRNHQVQIPYGVVRTEEDRISGIDEKPVEDFFVNAGIYVLEPELLQVVPEEGPFDMPELFDSLIDADVEVGAYPLTGYWRDVGREKDLEEAKQEYERVFR